jgi:hypothetical protein
MAIIDLTLFIVAALVLFTKYLDCQTTLLRIKFPNQEKNPIARKYMTQYGIKNVIWGVFILTIVIVTLSTFLLFKYYDSYNYKMIFISTGILVSIIQFAVAHANFTKNQNIITKLLLKIYKT